MSGTLRTSARPPSRTVCTTLVKRQLSGTTYSPSAASVIERNFASSSNSKIRIPRRRVSGKTMRTLMKLRSSLTHKPERKSCPTMPVLSFERN